MWYVRANPSPCDPNMLLLPNQKKNVFSPGGQELFKEKFNLIN